MYFTYICVPYTHPSKADNKNSTTTKAAIEKVCSKMLLSILSSPVHQPATECSASILSYKLVKIHERRNLSLTVEIHLTFLLSPESVNQRFRQACISQQTRRKEDKQRTLHKIYLQNKKCQHLQSASDVRLC